MNYRKYLTILAASTLFLAGCGTTKQVDLTVSTGTVAPSYTQNFVIGENGIVIENLYGTVVANNTKNLMNSIGGNLEFVNCQPGSTVTANTVIAKVVPSTSDVNVENTQIQNNYLKQQTNNLNEIMDSTDQNFDIQEETLNRQIDTNEKLLDNLREQKRIASSGSTNRSVIIPIENQINATRLTIKTLQDQIDALQNTREIQAETMTNQKLTLQQNSAIIANNLSSETLYAGMNGIVKTKLVSEGNKLNPGTIICQISPSDNDTLKLQVFSSFRIPVGTIVGIFADQIYLGTAPIGYELPSKDISTQNYVYEIPNFKLSNKEGDRLTIKLRRMADKNTIWIPIEAVTVQLDGNFVHQKIGSNTQETSVVLGDINGGNIQILSGLKKGDEIIY